MLCSIMKISEQNSLCYFILILFIYNSNVISKSQAKTHSKLFLKSKMPTFKNAFKYKVSRAEQ